MSDLNAGTFEFSKTLIYLSLSLIVFRIICDNVLLFSLIFCLLCAKLSTWRIEQASSMLLRLVAFLHFICLEAEKTRRKTAGEWKEHSIVLATKQSINFFFYFGKSYLCGLGFWYCGVCVQNKIQSLAGQHSDVLENLTPKVRKRVEFLKEIQACLCLFSMCFNVILLVEKVRVYCFKWCAIRSSCRVYATHSLSMIWTCCKFVTKLQTCAEC